MLTSSRALRVFVLLFGALLVASATVASAIAAVVPSGLWAQGLSMLAGGALGFLTVGLFIQFMESGQRNTA